VTQPGPSAAPSEAPLPAHASAGPLLIEADAPAVGSDAHGGVVPAAILSFNDGTIVAALSGLALALRIYLSIVSYCISGDGVAYVGIARHIAEGDYAHALASVFPPLYPALVVAVHAIVPNWELAADLISAILGALTVVPIFCLFRETLARRDLAIVAASLAAIDPELVGYSASVRTEAGYICLVAFAVWIAILAIRRQRVALALASGAITGVAYLYRTEAVGFALFVPVFVMLGALVWRQWRPGWALSAALAFAAAYLIVTSPYVAYLSRSAGHLAFSREFRAAVMYGMGDVSGNREKWQGLAYHGDASLLAPLLAAPRVFLMKFASDFAMSFYFMAEALNPLLGMLLLFGLFIRGRAIATEWTDAFLVLMILGYVSGFAISYTGPRFMVHLIPFMFGWIAIGLAATSQWIGKMILGNRMHPVWCGLAVGAVLIALAVQKDSYDVRGIRYAGEEIARTSSAPRSVVSDDKRFAYYADAQQIFLPPLEAKPDLCRWLSTERGQIYVALSDKEEVHYGVAGGAPCLVHVARYPRGEDRYYDLFKARN
jgi:hypothetical protein